MSEQSTLTRANLKTPRAAVHFARAAAYSMMNVYTIKMAGVFMVTTSTIAIYTGFAPRWIAILGYFLALLLLCGSYYLSWSFVVFPFWVLVMSIYIFFNDAGAKSAPERSAVSDPS